MVDYDAPIINGKVQPSATAAALLLESHAIASRVLLLDAESDATFELPLISGSVTMDSGSAVRRTATLDVYASWSDDPHSRLTPYGTRVRIQRGVRVALDTIEWMTLMEGRVVEVDSKSEDRDSRMTLSVKDDFYTLGTDRFDFATTTNTTISTTANIIGFITETFPGAPIVDLTGSTALAGAADLQQDRAAGIGKLATAISSEVYTGRDGTFIIAPVPTLDDSPRWQLTVGQSGNLVSVSRKRTADGVYNRVLAKGVSDAVSGTTVPPVTGEAVIDDVNDPLYYGGPFGRVTRFYTSPMLTTADQCTSAAAGILQKARGRNFAVSFTSLVNPALDPGDVLWSQLSDGVIRTHIVDSVTHPLTGSDTQAIEVRSIDLPAEDTSAA